MEAGLSKEDARAYAEGVRRDGTLVSARVSESDRSRADAAMEPSSVSLPERRAAWQKAGWTGFDPAAQP
jgi:hypothetical protein